MSGAAMYELVSIKTVRLKLTSVTKAQNRTLN